jgi:aldehyde:ferredoxin oxidoreductase
MFGYHGAYLRCDLSSGRTERVALELAELQRWIGGVGLGAWLLHREAPPGIDPLAPEAPLIFCFSPLVGTPLTTSAKFAVVGKSPLTGLVCDALSSSHFAIAGKAMGIDALVFVGRCAEPSIWASGRVELTSLWGSSAAAAERALAGRGRVAAIGPAGEAQVRYATISNEGRHAGRGGLGAIMGAKNLKAVVVDGAQRSALADPKAVVRRARDLSQRSLGPATAKYRELGTVGNLLAFNRLAALPTRGFQRGSFAGAASLSAEELQPQRERARRACASCTIGCEHIWATSDGGETRIEYESLFALGSLCGVADVDAVLAAAQRCDAHGLDTVSTGGTIAFAMECAERGYLREAPRFGDAAGMLELIDEIAQRRGLGALLAEGSRRAAIELGRDCLDFAPQVKGMELPGYEPRALQTMALGLAVGTRGADHNRSGAYELDFSTRVDRLHGDARSARLALDPEDRAALIDSLILCKFLRGVFDDLWTEAAAMLSEVTGEALVAADLRARARAIVDLKKAFNVREGWTPADDTLPRRFLTEPLLDGPARGARLEAGQLRGMIRAYNLARGWTEDGYLQASRWAELGLVAPGSTY